MSDFPPSDPQFAPNPYGSPQLEAPGDRDAPRGVPPRLTLVVVLLLVLSVMGLVASVTSALGTVFNLSMGSNLQSKLESAEEVSADELTPMQFQMKLQAGIMRITNQYVVFNSILLLVQAILCGFLIYASVQVLRRRPGSAQFLAKLCLVMIPFEIVKTGLSVWITKGISDVVRDLDLSAFEEGATIIRRVTLGSVIVGVVITVVWLLMKLAIFSYSSSRLRKQDVTDYLDATTS
ncbi:MAG: hypothetical protein KDA60_07605 [Planctomycetales bacterium]|nr:hypothetical protein [Planctomycetales bacterium]